MLCEHRSKHAPDNVTISRDSVLHRFTFPQEDFCLETTRSFWLNWHRLSLNAPWDWSPIARGYESADEVAPAIAERYASVARPIGWTEDTLDDHGASMNSRAESTDAR